MDNLTKGALGATVILILGAVGFGVMTSTKNTNRMMAENEALKQQMAEDRKQREDDKTAEMERRMAESEAQAKKQREEMEAQLAALRTKMNQDAEERRIMEAERTQLTETIAETVGKGGIDSGTDAELNAMQKKILGAASIGASSRSTRSSALSSSGPARPTGSSPTSVTMSAREKFIVGEVLISSVEDQKHSVANIVSGSTQPGLSLRAGDELISHPVY